MSILDEINKYFNMKEYKSVGEFNGDFLSGRLGEVYVDDSAKVLALLMFLKSLEDEDNKDGVYKMNDLAIEGNVEVNGVTVPQIVGCFGEGEKAIMAKHVAEIHGKKLKFVNQTIKNNKTRFEDGIDVLDIKMRDDILYFFMNTKMLSKAQIGNAKNIYLLSERGYKIYCNIIEDAIISTKVLKHYFNRENNYISVIAEKRKEIIFRKNIKDLFDDAFTVISQYPVGQYRVDLYIPELKLAIEYDEAHHQRQKTEDRLRQNFIEDQLGCNFIRVKENENYITVINKILQHISQSIQLPQNKNKVLTQ